MDFSLEIFVGPTEKCDISKLKDIVCMIRLYLDEHMLRLFLIIDAHGFYLINHYIFLIYFKYM